MYKDMCHEIDFLRAMLHEHESTMLYWKGQMSGNHVPLDIAYARYVKWENAVAELRDHLKQKEREKKEFEQQLSQLDGLEYRVAYMRDVKGMNLIQISLDLGKSYDWIKKISARTSRKKRTPAV